MLDEVSISIIQNVINAQKDLVIIFHDSEVVMVNKSFKKFFAVSTLEQYKRDFEAFENNFVPLVYQFVIKLFLSFNFPEKLLLIVCNEVEHKMKQFSLRQPPVMQVQKRLQLLHNKSILLKYPHCCFIIHVVYLYTSIFIYFLKKSLKPGRSKVNYE